MYFLLAGVMDLFFYLRSRTHRKQAPGFLEASPGPATNDSRRIGEHSDRPIH